MDHEIIYLFGGILSLLAVASMTGFVLARRYKESPAKPIIDNLNARTKAWWQMCAIFAVSLLASGIGSVILFGLISFLALREFITLTPTKKADHKTLFWVFFIILPYQYYLVYARWYGLFAIMIPVYAFLLIPVRSVLAGDTNNFLERTAKIQWGVMVCVYCMSHVPALLMLDISDYAGENIKLLLFLTIVAQMSDVLQYVFGKLFGKHKVVPDVSPNKTWEGLVGGVISASLIGMGLWWSTPFSPLAAFAISLLITIMGFAGGLVMSAIKRDRGIKDFGNIIQGHGGMMDRIDSLCFAAPVFFHVVRYYYT
jgi:phosphatidate cytidylyltransferase